MTLQFSPETKGTAQDWIFMQEGAWLKDSEVRYYIAPSKGRWCLTMLYISIHDPLRFICQEMADYESEKKAILHAELFKRTMQKDARGTQKTNQNVINLHPN
ncbi:MAG: hypothetical protein EAZ55_13190 [Cytophagales bacterium]|nr:MAG: hypothetical protein EAZ55_13190 [Cytophagales bacterium]